jgi:hypothetical protein
MTSISYNKSRAGWASFALRQQNIAAPKVISLAVNGLLAAMTEMLTRGN